MWSCRWEDNKTSLIYVEDNCILLSWIWFPLSPLFSSGRLRVWSTLLSPAIRTLTPLALYRHWLGANDLSPKLRGRGASHYSFISLISERVRKLHVIHFVQWNMRSRLLGAGASSKVSYIFKRHQRRKRIYTLDTTHWWSTLNKDGRDGCCWRYVFFQGPTQHKT